MQNKHLICGVHVLARALALRCEPIGRVGRGVRTGSALVCFLQLDNAAAVDGKGMQRLTKSLPA